jgi:ABC-2 type transport system ATP-binding protein
MSNTATILVLEAQNVGYSANKKTILRSVSFTLKKGRIYALLGPNGGAGNTTLIKAILGLLSLEGRMRFK